MKLLIATGNPHKRTELTDLLAGMPVEILSLLDFPDKSRAEQVAGRLAGDNADTQRARVRNCARW